MNMIANSSEKTIGNRPNVYRQISGSVKNLHTSGDLSVLCYRASDSAGPESSWYSSWERYS